MEDNLVGEGGRRDGEEGKEGEGKIHHSMEGNILLRGGRRLSHRSTCSEDEGKVGREGEGEVGGEGVWRELPIVWKV